MHAHASLSRDVNAATGRVDVIQRTPHGSSGQTVRRRRLPLTACSQQPILTIKDSPAGSSLLLASVLPVCEPGRRHRCLHTGTPAFTTFFGACQRDSRAAWTDGTSHVVTLCALQSAKGCVQASEAFQSLLSFRLSQLCCN